MAKKNRNDLLDRLSAWPVKALVGLTGLLPYRGRLAVGAFIGRRIVTMSPRLRKRVDTNLAYIFPDMTPGERARVLQATGDSFGRTFIEILHSERFVKEAKIVAPTGPGAEAALAAGKAGKGAVLVSGHFGQWEGCRLWMMRNGYPCAGVYRPTENPHLNAIYSEGLAGTGRPMFSKGPRGTRGLVGHLKKNNIVSLLIDQYDHRAKPIDFVGRPAPTSTVAAELALKYGVPLIPITSRRMEDGMSLEVVADAPVEHTNAIEMMEKVNAALAARIRQWPAQYYWLHRRWSKSLPEPGTAASATVPDAPDKH